jgi:2-polyprenyl-6-methoxyphenol hydroxylase-like FAD-dependent oxidoreductase
VFGSGMARDSERGGLGGHRAIVIGGSMAGLTAARVLADHFEEVLLVERDALPDTDEPRKGVPQGRQLHGLLGRGEEILEALFPGLGASLVDAGAVRVDFGRDVRWHHFGVDKVRFESGVLTTTMTRPFLERMVRRRLFALPNVRRSRPDETEIRINVCYATRLYHRPEPTGLPYQGLYIIGKPPESKRLGVLGGIEGNRWIALVAGMLGDHPPADPEGFLEFAKGLPIDDLHRILSTAEPASDVALYKFPSHLRRHYERMPGFPDGLVVLGDSHCSFNPIYGQGMTTAALGALVLGECLEEHRPRGSTSLAGLSQRFQARLAKQTDGPWAMATGEDLRYPEVEAERPLGYGFMKWYTGRVHQAVAHDTALALRFLRVMHMLEPPTALLTPAMALRVLAGGRSR